MRRPLASWPCISRCDLFNALPSSRYSRRLLTCAVVFLLLLLRRLLSTWRFLRPSDVLYSCGCSLPERVAWKTSTPSGFSWHGPIARGDHLEKQTLVR